MIKARSAHLVLFQLVTAENDQLCWLVFAQHNIDELFSKRAGSTGNENNFVRPIHVLPPSIR
jgi:hypothetical protein